MAINVETIKKCVENGKVYLVGANKLHGGKVDMEMIGMLLEVNLETAIKQASEETTTENILEETFDCGILRTYFSTEDLEDALEQSIFYLSDT